MVKFCHDRVMTVSFHKYGDMFFPGTGDAKVIFFILFVFTFSKLSDFNFANDSVAIITLMLQ